MKLSLSHTHKPNGDIWNPHCRVCGVALLDGGLAPADLCERVTAAFQQKIQPTGRVRGTWIEVEELLDDECWMWWVRPASNLLGFEAVEHPAENPTGHELSMAFLAEMLTAPAEPATADLPEPAMPARHKARKAFRWARTAAWRPSADTREFVPLAAALVGVEALVVGWLLGWSGITAVFGSVWSLFS